MRILLLVFLVLTVNLAHAKNCLKVIEPLHLVNLDGTAIPSMVIEVKKCSKKH
jgi:hypothetical protein